MWRVVWFPCQKEVRDAYGVPDYTGPIPYFLSGETLELFEQEKKIFLTQDMLIYGILAIFEDALTGTPDKFPDVDPKSLARIAFKYTNGFEYSSIADLALITSEAALKNFGTELSGRILRSGLHLTKIPYFE